MQEGLGIYQYATGEQKMGLWEKGQRVRWIEGDELSKLKSELDDLRKQIENWINLRSLCYKTQEEWFRLRIRPAETAV